MLKYIILALTVSSVFSAVPLTCPAGEYLDAVANPNQCMPCMKNCLTCSSGTVCTSCKDRYFPYSSGASCELKTLITTANCVQIVDKAASPTVCSKCENPYWLKSDKTCVGKTIAQCKTWTDDAATETCTTYNDGFSKPGDTLLNCTKVHEKCLTCTAETAAACASCASDSYLVGGTCVVKTKNCKTWDETSTTEKCSTCETGYSVHPLEFNCYAAQCLNQKCGFSKARSSAPHCNVNCHEPKCNDCTTDAADACTECVEGYSLTSGKKCFQNLANCVAMTDIDHCATCADNYHLNADSTECVTITNCERMQNETHCLSCKYGYDLLLNECIEIMIDNCEWLQNKDTCNSCSWGYTLISNACVKNIVNCAEMQDQNTCKTCNTYFVINEGSTVCEGIDNCYSMSDSTHCSKCKDPYYVNDDNSACVTIANCKTMISKDNCFCLTGYSFYNNICVKNIDNCKQMSTATRCVICEDYYYFDGVACIANPDHCSDYSDIVKECVACSDGYYLDAKAICIQCTDVNAKYIKLDCTEEQRVDFPWTCVDLTSNCKENNPTPLIGEAEQDCKVCKTGYRLKADHTCEACDVTNCHLCDAAKATCTECKFGYYLKDHACTACDTTCPICEETNVEGSSICLGCKDKYTFSNENQSICTACPANCDRCFSSTHCVLCSTGYYFKTVDSCIACPTGSECNDCVGQDCCEEGFYYYNYVVDDECRTCVENCKVCTGAGQCTTCNDGYTWDSINKQCYKAITCVDNCKVCTDVDQCTTCNDGYTWDSTNKQCSKAITCVDNCKVCTDVDQCTTCNDGYTWDSTNKQCSTSTSSYEFKGYECLAIIDCIQCSTTDTSKCALCASGSSPVEDKCSCDTGKLLIGGVCVTQVAEMPEDISAKSLDDLSGLVTAALKTEKDKATNTKNVLSRVKGILNEDGGKTNKNAGTALQLLLSFSDTATDKDAQTSYESVLTTSCGISDLDQTNFQVAFAAADKFMTTSSNSKKIYDLGFSTCLTNLLKKDTIKDISPMKLTNSELTVKKFSTTDGEKTLGLTDITATANADFMTAVGTGNYYVKFQSIKRRANPYQNVSINNVTLSSKIVSLQVMSSGASPVQKKVTLAENKTFPVKFDAVATSAKCGYYDTANKKWVEDGVPDETKTCQYSHLADFAIISTTSETTKEEKKEVESAQLIQTIYILLIFVIALL